MLNRLAVNICGPTDKRLQSHNWVSYSMLCIHPVSSLRDKPVANSLLGGVRKHFCPTDGFADQNQGYIQQLLIGTVPSFDGIVQ